MILPNLVLAAAPATFTPRPVITLRCVSALIAELSCQRTQPEAVAEWVEMALAEHASIASFALTAQKLCAVGAPAGQSVLCTHSVSLPNADHDAAMISEALVCAQVRKRVVWLLCS